MTKNHHSQNIFSSVFVFTVLAIFLILAMTSCEQKNINEAQNKTYDNDNPELFPEINPFNFAIHYESNITVQKTADVEKVVSAYVLSNIQSNTLINANNPRMMKFNSAKPYATFEGKKYWQADFDIYINGANGKYNQVYFKDWEGKIKHTYNLHVSEDGIVGVFLNGV